MAFNIRRYLGIDGTKGVINYDCQEENPIPDELLNRLDVDINELIGYIVGRKLKKDDDRPERPPPTTPQDFKDVCNDFIKDNNLGGFYPPGDQRVEDLSNNAANNLADPAYPIKDPEKMASIVRICLYDVCLYCDDSYSMTQENRIAAQATFVRRFGRVILPMKEGSISMRFINANGNGTWDKMTNMDAMEAAVKGVPYTGYTPIGAMLKSKILEPMLYAKLRAPAKNPAKGIMTGLEKPLFVLVITDGWPYLEANDHFRNVIVESVNEVEKYLGKDARNTAIRYQVNQIGHEERATAFITGLFNDAALKPNVHCTSEKLDDKIQELKDNEANLDNWLVDNISTILKEKKPKKTKKPKTPAAP
ncbi:hypothetical protein FPQ18DRAFT_342378 [Pyronema domesticum]|uniref:Similar to ankyrin repeat protein [Ajellomyces dermatitidis ER-3] acc. no. EEQ85046 n=1 Tax=Pyronema omphalodes (strain CBS 100304) TaxID=1076935 RepID=U4L6B9_PYROM|nr:hypothetical protein FPQ18DRAFT_342378 [Pyronema domesticum]CCX12336.1 Similar to ankyrin repeat protein [Ajellomyces dermatitidis ER-3]; acc. no. EEQ85046 [Pyronema omphalodes CBS 100304]